MLPAVFFHSSIKISLTMNVPMLTTKYFGAQQKLMQMEIIIQNGRNAMKIAQKVD